MRIDKTGQQVFVPVIFSASAIAIEMIDHLRFGADFEDSDGWESQTGLPADGAVLIRPDGHVAARFDAVSAEAVASVMNEILARSA